MTYLGSRQSDCWHQNFGALAPLAEGYLACAQLQNHNRGPTTRYAMSVASSGATITSIH